MTQIYDMTDGALGKDTKATIEMDGGIEIFSLSTKRFTFSKFEREEIEARMQRHLSRVIDLPILVVESKFGTDGSYLNFEGYLKTKEKIRTTSKRKTAKLADSFEMRLFSKVMEEMGHTYDEFRSKFDTEL